MAFTSYPPMATDFDKYEFLTRRFLLPSKETPMEFSPPNAITSAHQHESTERALSQLWGQRPTYVEDRMKAMDSTKHRMGGLIVRNKQDREAANELLRNREAFFREQEDMKPLTYKTPTSFLIEGQLDDLTDQLFSEIASGVISTNTMASASNLRTFILGNGSLISMQKLVDVRNLIEGALSDVRMEGAVDSKMKVILDAVLKSLVKTKEILEKLIALHQQGMTRQSYDQIIRALRNDQALESREKLKDFQSITKARMRAMDRRRGQSTRFSATDSSSSLGYGPGDDDDDDDDEDGGGGDGGDVEEEEGGGTEEGDDEGPVSFPAAALDFVGQRPPNSPLYLAGQPPSNFPVLSRPKLGPATKPKVRTRGAFWPFSLLMGAPQTPSEGSAARSIIEQRFPQERGRFELSAPPFVEPPRAMPPRRGWNSLRTPLGVQAPFVPSSADLRALARDLQSRELAEQVAAAPPYVPSAGSIQDYTRKKRKQNWNAFLERNAGRGLSMDELRRRYQLIQAAAEAAAR